MVKDTERTPMPGPSFSSPREKSRLFFIFLDLYEDLSLGQWPGKGRNNPDLSVSPAGSHTDGHCGGDAENLAPGHAV